MDEIDLQIQAAQQELAALRAEPAPSMARQFAFDVPVGLSRALAGTADVLAYPVVKGLEYAGAPVETFGLSKLLSAGAEQVAPSLGVEPETGTQELVSFLAPTPLSKAKLLSQAGTGLASYLGMKGAEYAAPESEYAGLVGALAGPGLATGAGRLAGMSAPVLEEAGKGLQRASLNVRKTDLTSAKNAILQSEEALGLPQTSAEKLSTTQVTKSLNNLIDSDVLGKSRNPTVLYDNAIVAKEAIEEQIQAALKSADASGIKIKMPSFSNSLKYLNENRVDLSDVDSYKSIIKEFQTAVKNESAFVAPTLPTLYDEFGNVVSATESPTMQKALKAWEQEQIGRSKLSLDVLNKQRKVFGEKYKQGPQADRGFWRAFYRDIKEHIEKYAPEIQQLNKKKQDLIVAQPILEQAKKASEKPFTMQDARRALLYTTGGSGLVGATYLTGGNPLLAALISGGLALAGTGRGQDIIGRRLRGTASLAEALGGAGLDIGQTLSRGGIAAAGATETAEAPMLADDMDAAIEAARKELEALRAEPAPTPQPETVEVGKQNISIPTGEKYAPPELVKAVIQVESAGKPNAVSSKGAGGLMQLMPATARQLGVADRFDPEQNVEGGSRYLQQMITKYGKKIGVAAYNWGPHNVDKAIKKVKLNKKDITWENILKTVKVPAETRLYVNKVLSKEKKV
jgi:hypothetical protein